MFSKRYMQKIGGNPLAENIIYYQDYNNNYDDKSSDPVSFSVDGTINYSSDSIQGQSISLDRTQQLRFGNPSKMDFGSNAFSCSIWLKKTSLLGNEYIFIKWNLGSVVDLYIRILSGELRIRLANGNANFIEQATNWGGVLPTTEWFNIIFTVDGSNVANGIKIYQDSILLADNSSSGGVYNGLPTGVNEWFLGRNIANGYVGLLDEVYFFDKELNSDEALFVYNQGLLGNTLI